MLIVLQASFQPPLSVSVPRPSSELSSPVQFMLALACQGQYSPNGLVTHCPVLGGASTATTRIQPNDVNKGEVSGPEGETGRASGESQRGIVNAEPGTQNLGPRPSYPPSFHRWMSLISVALCLPTARSLCRRSRSSWRSSSARASALIAR